MWYHCVRQCDGFMQVELFGEERVPVPMERDDTPDGSVEDQTYGGPPHPAEGLPF